MLEECTIGTAEIETISQDAYQVSVVVRRMYYWDCYFWLMSQKNFIVSVVVRRMYYWDSIVFRFVGIVWVSVVVRRMYYWDLDVE